MTTEEKAKKFDQIVEVVKSLEQEAIDDGMEDVDLDTNALGEEIYYEIIKT